MNKLRRLDMDFGAHKQRVVIQGVRNLVSEEKMEFAKHLRRNQTPAEQHLWRQLVARQVGIKFKRQIVIRGWIVDFYCGRAALAIEIDGPCHDRRKAEDERRDRVMKGMGIEVMRFTNEQVMSDVMAVVGAIRDRLVQLGYNLPPIAESPR